MTAPKGIERELLQDARNQLYLYVANEGDDRDNPITQKTWRVIARLDYAIAARRAAKKAKKR